jgi:hypothetical protein
MASATKTCGYCHQDCSTKPRLRDEAGNYYCKECYPLAQAEGKTKAAAGRVAPGGVGAASVFADPIIPTPDLVVAKDEPKKAAKAEAKTEEATRNCQSCGIMMPARAVVCTNCGFNSKLKKELKTKIQKPEVIKGPKVRQAGARDPMQILALVATGIAVLGGLGGMGLGFALGNGPAFLAGLLIVGLYGAIGGFSALITAFMQDTVQGLLYMFVPFYALYWLLVRCESGPVKMLNFTAIALWAVAGGIMGAGGIAMLDGMK